MWVYHMLNFSTKLHLIQSIDLDCRLQKLAKGPFLPYFVNYKKKYSKLLRHNNKNTNVCDMGTSKLLINEIMLPV